jgi:hypothetical protein
MLRFLAVVLLAANVLFFGFTRGWFDGLSSSVRSTGDREPERLSEQVRPNSIVLMPMSAASAIKSGTDATTCLEAGPIAAADSALAEAALRGVLPPGAWIDSRVETPVGAAIVVTHSYRVLHADAATAPRLAALKLDASGHAFSACAASQPGR